MINFEPPWFGGITEQVNLIIDGQSSRFDQGSRKRGAGYNVPPPIVHTHLCHGRIAVNFSIRSSIASSYNDILGLKLVIN